MACSWLLLGGSALLAGWAWAGESAQSGKPKEPDIKVQVEGTLRHGVVAIGGETTGTEITAGGTTWELDLGSEQRLQRLAARLDGKSAVAVGAFELRRGVEVPVRRIVKVVSLKEGKAKPKASKVSVRFRGTVEHGVMAIGCETTGTTITAKKITWELELKGRKELIRAAEELDGKTAVATGTLMVHKGVELPERWVITVETLAAEARD